MNALTAPWKVWSSGILDALSSLTLISRWLRLSHKINSHNLVTDDFFGINIATSEDPRCDDYVISCLTDLGIRHVRMDYCYDSQGASAQRLLDRIIAEGFDVMLDLIPGLDQAKALSNDEAARQRWRGFLTDVFNNYSNKVSVFEIGNTPNRGNWSGFNGVSYVYAWQIATEVAESFSIDLAGPNISDFEPLYNVAFLKSMKRAHSAPKIHTDNLFVERVVEPEAYDHRVLGRWVTRILNFNLIKKARLIADIGLQLGCEKTYCTYKCWTRKRLTRWSATPDQKNADYIVRYLIIAAASGALDRVYWGPLICHRDGLIDCGDTSYPIVDNVSFYKKVRGSVENFQVTEAYGAFKYIIGLIRHVTCLQGVTADNGINHFVFEAQDGAEIHIIWCADRSSASLSDIYCPDDLKNAEHSTIYGEINAYKPMMVSEKPLILKWNSKLLNRPPIESISLLKNTKDNGILFHTTPGLQSTTVNTPHWGGVVAVPHDADMDATLAAYMPNSLNSAEELRILRDGRNRLWNVCLDPQRDEQQTVKLNRAKGMKKFTYRFMESKGKRHWNNATEMLRRGINTPQPLAFFERHHRSGIRENYYVCRFVPNAFSARDVFSAFNQGKTKYQGIPKAEMFNHMAGFIARMHARGVIHRDLSAGNLMMTLKDGELDIFAIDIGRAKINVKGGVKNKHRFLDLKRICYKPEWPDRELFIQAYNSHIHKPLPNWWKISIFAYEFKHILKKIIKGKRKLKVKHIFRLKKPIF